MNRDWIRRRQAVLMVVIAALVAPLAIIPLEVTASTVSTTFKPVADTYVSADNLVTSYGTSSQFVVDNSPVRRAFLKFDVSGLSGQVAKATLRLHVRNAVDAGSGSGSTVQIDLEHIVVRGHNALEHPARQSRNDIDQRRRRVLRLRAVRRDGATTHRHHRHLDTRHPPVQPTENVLVGAGDTASCGSTGDEATANLLDTIAGTLFTAGDNACASGTSTECSDCYDPSWGRHRWRTRPSTGNHDYYTSGATAYYAYFGANAGDASKGYYSYDVAGWHVIAVNSSCAAIGGCGVGSPQEQWLRADLAASTAKCTVAYWHHPVFTSGAAHANSTEMRPIFQALYDAGADVVINGHAHNYERFAPQSPSGALDTARGIREFVVGTGGASRYVFGTPIPNSEVRNADTYGVLKLTLASTSYTWQFVPVAGQTFTDAGSASCH